MTKARTKSESSSGDPIAAYNGAQPAGLRALCDALRERIDAALPKASSKVWHGSPVWFVGENPVVGYEAKTKQERVELLFWNGRAFDEPEFVPVGKHGAARAEFTDASELEPAKLRRWLKKAATDVFDSKAYFAKLRKGE